MNKKCCEEEKCNCNVKKLRKSAISKMLKKQKKLFKENLGSGLAKTMRKSKKEDEGSDYKKNR